MGELPVPAPKEWDHGTYPLYIHLQEVWRSVLAGNTEDVVEETAGYCREQCPLSAEEAQSVCRAALLRVLSAGQIGEERAERASRRSLMSHN